jgi:prepilin-type N-terminal cleavage/methylation domain-containing protein
MTMRACHRQRSPRGFTLIELLVVIGILTLMLGISAVVILHPRDDSAHDVGAQLLEVRRVAIRAHAPRSAMVTRGDSSFAVTAWPDGSVTADVTLDVDPTTGAVGDARR